jgi:DNA-nicking Smr family endonuclease
MDSDMFDYPIDGVLDLHMFLPKEVKSALAEYLHQCRLRGILRVRIIHGRGEGVLRQIVRSYLDSCGFVREYSTPPDASGWGATIAILEPLPEDDCSGIDEMDS